MSLFDLDILFFRSLFSRWYPFSDSQIRRYAATIDWVQLSLNPMLEWSSELLEAHEDNWNWGDGGLCMNINFPQPLIERFKSRWPEYTLAFSEEKGLFSCYTANSYTEDISNVKIISPASDIKRYFSEFVVKQDDPRRSWITISANSDIEWSKAFIRENANKLKWEDTIVLNIHYYDSYEMIDRYAGICSNSSVNIDREFIEEFIDQICWASLGLNENIEWSIELLKEFEEHWFWSWDDHDGYGDEDFIWYNMPDYDEKDHYKYTLEDFYLSANHMLPWNEELLEEFKDVVDWAVVSKAYYIPWSVSLLKNFFPFFKKERLVGNFSLWEKVFRLPVSENKKIIEAVFTP